MDAALTQQIPDDHSVVRQLGKQKWDFADDGITIVIDSQAFLPRDDFPEGTGPEEYVSVHWLEYFSGTFRQQLDQVRTAIEARGRTVGQQSKFGVAIVESVHKAARLHKKSVDVRTTGEIADPSHAGIYGLEPSDHLIAEEIAQHAVAHSAYQ